MDTKTKIVKWVLYLFGGLFISLSLFDGLSRFVFILNANQTHGVVVDLDSIISGRVNPSNKYATIDDFVYAPKIEFITENNRKIIFTSGNYSRPASYAIGDTVTVKFSKTNPSKATIDEQFPYIMDLIFISIGLVVIVIAFFVLKTNRKLKTNERINIDKTVTIYAEYLRVDENKTNSTFIIVCKWFNTETNHLHEFKSIEIKYNPQHLLTSNQKLKVIYNSINMDNYEVDISFLPFTSL